MTETEAVKVLVEYAKKKMIVGKQLLSKRNYKHNFQEIEKAVIVLEERFREQEVLDILDGEDDAKEKGS